MMKMRWIVLGIVLVAVLASIDAACHEKNPGYCARHHHLCKDEHLKEKMKKVCPRTCGYCKYASNEGCHEKYPGFCERHSHLCHVKPFAKKMKEVCPKTCGYCKFTSNEVCRDARGTSYCAERKNLCDKDFFRDMMKQYCRKTCGYCTGGSTDPPPQTLPPGKTTRAPVYTGKCGQPEVRGPRVIAGTSARRGVWPWQILLIYRGRASCGGTLITPQWVVTAAHCVYRREQYPSSYIVRVGEYNRFVEQGSEINVRVTKIVRFPGYDPRHLNNDIALLKLDFPVILNKYVQPACLPSQDPPVGSKCYITGWGKIKHPGDMISLLQQGMLPVVSNKKCYEKNKHTIGVPITDAMICAGSDDKLTSGCHGDSGGPFVCRINGKWELHGAVSHGSPTCNAHDTYTVFSRVNHFKEWIKKSIATE